MLNPSETLIVLRRVGFGPTVINMERRRVDVIIIGSRWVSTARRIGLLGVELLLLIDSISGSRSE